MRRISWVALLLALVAQPTLTTLAQAQAHRQGERSGRSQQRLVLEQRQDPEYEVDRAEEG